MRAVRIARPGGPEVLTVEDVEAPEPGRGEVLVQVRAAGLNRADLLQRRGGYPAPPGAPPDIPGLEYAGTIAAAGAGVDASVVGLRVMGLVPGGAYAERLAVPFEHTIPIPDRLGFVEAAAVPEAFATAWDALEQATMVEGETILVHAAGSGVGTAALQLARYRGASWIVGTASAGKLAAIRERGLPLDTAVDYGTESFRDVIGRDTGGKGVDVILELVGARYWEDDLASLADRGRLLLIGLMSGSRAPTDLATILRRRLTVRGTVMRTRSAEEKTEVARSMRQDVLPGLSEGTLVPVLHSVFPLEEAADAHAEMEANRNFGKIVLEIG